MAMLLLLALLLKDSHKSMINLVPPHAKKGLLIEYWVRVLSAWLTLWASTLLVSACILYPAYILIGSQVTVYEESAKEASEKVATYENVSTALVRASIQARFILDETSAISFSEYLKLFQSLQGGSVELSRIAINRTASGVSPVDLVGVAADRQSLASFRDRLLAEESVVSVDLPISNLARDKDIPFNITVVLNNET